MTPGDFSKLPWFFSHGPRCCSRALQHGPCAAALLRRARAQLALGRGPEAAADLDAAEVLDAESAEPLGFRCRARGPVNIMGVENGG